MKPSTATAKKESNKNRVQSLLYWNAEQYAYFQYEAGLQYLKDNLLGGDDTWLNELSKSRIYWQWWINQWNIRDQEFLNNVETITAGNLGSMIDMYCGSHDPASLDVHPHKTVMEETYAVMMQQFIDETMKQPC